jgi:putative transposase
VITRQDGPDVADAVRDIGVKEVTYFRGHQKFGVLKFDQIKRLTDLETENGRLRRAVADLTLNKFIFNEDAWDPQGSASKTA